MSGSRNSAAAAEWARKKKEREERARKLREERKRGEQGGTMTSYGGATTQAVMPNGSRMDQVVFKNTIHSLVYSALSSVPIGRLQCSHWSNGSGCSGSVQPTNGRGRGGSSSRTGPTSRNIRQEAKNGRRWLFWRGWWRVSSTCT